LGAFGALGDRNKAIEQGGLLYPGLHGALALGGTVLILTSGDGSGTGFLGNSIMGNQPLRGSPDDVIALEQTSYDLGSQSWQYARLEAGAQLLAYGVNGVIDFATGRFRYLHLKDCEDGGADKPACPQYKKATSAGPANQPLVSGLKLNVQLDSQFQGATLSGNIQ
jgi:hypothetical protein